MPVVKNSLVIIPSLPLYYGLSSVWYSTLAQSIPNLPPIYLKNIPTTVISTRLHVNIFLSCCLQAATAGTGDWALRSAPAQHSGSEEKMTS